VAHQLQFVLWFSGLFALWFTGLVGLNGAVELFVSVPDVVYCSSLSSVTGAVMVLEAHVLTAPVVLLVWLYGAFI